MSIHGSSLGMYVRPKRGKMAAPRKSAKRDAVRGAAARKGKR